MSLKELSEFKSDDITNIMNVIFFTIRNYFIYILPGFITIQLNNFIKGIETVVNKKTIILSFLVSYIYTVLLNSEKLIILVSIIIPFVLIFLRFINNKLKILEFLKIETSLNNNILDHIKSLESDRNKGITLKVYLNNSNVMYEGKLRVHESNKDREQLICLSGYREYHRNNEGKYKVYKKLYENDNSKWIIIKYNEIKIIEVAFEESK